MKTMKKIGMLAASLLLSFACNRAEMPKDAPAASEEGMIFKASLSPMTRSHFGENETTDGTLYWDTTDNVLIAAVLQGSTENGLNDMSDLLDAYLLELSEGYGANETYIGSIVERYIHTTIATPQIQSDPTKALLRCRVTAKQLMPEREEVADALYEFIAIYPVSDTRPLKMLFWAGETPGRNAAVGYPVEIAHVQNGKDYGRYHICFDSGFQENNPPYYGLRRAADILDEENPETVSFDHLRPATSLLRFDLKSDSSEPFYIKKLVIELDSERDKLSGDAFVSTWGDDIWFVPNRWDADANTYNDVILQFGTPVKVTSAGTREIFYAVIQPSYSHAGAPQCANQYGAETIRFYGYDSADNLVLTATKTAPAAALVNGSYDSERAGFRAGQRYDFTLEMAEVKVPEDEIWYETVSGNPVVPFNGRTDFWQGASSSTATLVSNTYVNGQGVLKFDQALKKQDANAFEGVTDLKSIRFPDTITSLSSRGFYGCTALASVTLPKSLSYIGANCFQGCSALKTLVIPKNNDSSGPYGYPTVGVSAFADCTGLQTVTFLTENYPPNLQGPNDPFSNTTCVFYVQPAVFSAVQNWNNGSFWCTYRDAGRLFSL